MGAFEFYLWFFFCCAVLAYCMNYLDKLKKEYPKLKRLIFFLNTLAFVSWILALWYGLVLLEKIF